MKITLWSLPLSISECGFRSIDQIMVSTPGNSLVAYGNCSITVNVSRLFIPDSKRFSVIQVANKITVDTSKLVIIISINLSGKELVLWIMNHKKCIQRNCSTKYRFWSANKKSIVWNKLILNLTKLYFAKIHFRLMGAGFIITRCSEKSKHFDFQLLH